MDEPELTIEAKELLEDHYGHQVRAAMPQVVKMMAVPTVGFAADQELVDAIEDSAINFGIDPSTVDWATVIPQLIAAITTGSWFSLIPLFIKYGPAFYALVQQIIAMFRGEPVTGGPTITG